MTSLLTFTGATGTQGRAIINHFLKHEPQYRIRGLTRNTSSSKAQELSGLGVQMVSADYDDLASLKSAFAGSEAIFAYTDFSSLLQTSMATELVSSGKADSLAHAARFIAIQQGKNVADAAASIAGLKHLIWSSTADTDTISSGRYAGAYELENKAVVLRYMRSLPTLQDKVSAFYPAIFLNAVVVFPWFFGWEKIGDRAYTFRVPIEPKTKLPWTDMDVEAGRFVAALLHGPAGTDVDATTMHFSFEDLAGLLERKYKVAIEVKKVSQQEYVGEDASGYALNGYYMLAFMQEYGAIGHDALIKDPGELVPDHAERRSIEDIDWTKMLDA